MHFMDSGCLDSICSINSFSMFGIVVSFSWIRIRLCFIDAYYSVRSSVRSSVRLAPIRSSLALLL